MLNCCPDFLWAAISRTLSCLASSNLLCRKVSILHGWRNFFQFLKKTFERGCTYPEKRWEVFRDGKKSRSSSNKLRKFSFENSVNCASGENSERYFYVFSEKSLEENLWKLRKTLTDNKVFLKKIQEGYLIKLIYFAISIHGNFLIKCR